MYVYSAMFVLVAMGPHQGPGRRTLAPHPVLGAGRSEGSKPGNVLGSLSVRFCSAVGVSTRCKFRLSAVVLSAWSRRSCREGLDYGFPSGAQMQDEVCSRPSALQLRGDWKYTSWRSGCRSFPTPRHPLGHSANAHP